MRAERPRISLFQARRQGATVLTLSCVTERAGPAPYGGGPNVCGHRRDMALDAAIATFGGATSLSLLPLVCSVCGGRDIDARAWWPTPHGLAGRDGGG